MLSGCATDPPIHPFRLEDFPGHPIEGDLFPLRDGATWVFLDRKSENPRPKRFQLLKRESWGLEKGYFFWWERNYYLQRPEGPELAVRIVDGYLQIGNEGEPVARPLKLSGETGDRWKFGGARATVFGYDRIKVLGERRRALVTALDRDELRDLYWFVDGVGWARMRTERRGRVIRDQQLIEFEPGSAN